MLPTVERVEVVPRPGRVQLLEFPIVQTGSVEGTTLFASERPNRSVGNVRLQLVGIHGDIVATTVSEYDGFYVFERVLPGEYVLQLESERASELNIELDAAASVHVSATGSVVRGVTLIVRRRSGLLSGITQ
jgi:hypothetical protein